MPRRSEGMKACLPGTQPGPGGTLDGTVSVSLRGRAFRSGFSPDGRDTHFQTLVRRPPTPDTVRAPGPDAVRRQVLDRRQIRALLPHVSHNRVAPPLLPPDWIWEANHLPFKLEGCKISTSPWSD